MQGAAAMAGGVREDQVAVASTGVIGVPLDAGEVIRGHRRARAASCASTAHGDFSEAIRTTDKFAKEIEVDVALPSGTVRLTAQAKGAGMISPAFATMLCFVQTDAALAAETADLLLGVCVARSFDRVSRRRAALHQRHRDPAGLGRVAAWRSSRRPRTRCASARRWTGRCASSRWTSCATARAPSGSAAWSCAAATRTSWRSVARAIANSPLVKAALHGGDPNWGRIAQAVGAALYDTAPLALDIFDRGRAGLRRRARRSPLRRRRAGRGGRGRRGRVRRSRCPATAPRPRSSSPTSRTST